jgi:hypothetical protein
MHGSAISDFLKHVFCKRIINKFGKKEKRRRARNENTFASDSE